MIAYKTSKDYKHLIELLDKGIEVVCFYTHDWNEFDKDRPGYEKIMVKVYVGRRYAGHTELATRYGASGD